MVADWKVAMRLSGAIPCALALAACAPLAAVPSPALPAAIAAAERAPLNGWARENGWNEPMEPFTVFANIHYVGSKAVSAWLITGPKGHVLIDGIVPQSAPVIAANIAKLGYDIRDVKWLLNSHAHFDHAGGLAGLKARSGAKLAASAADKPFLEAGDIGHGPSAGVAFPPVKVDRVIRDGDQVRAGPTILTAHLTPGHSPGCTSWSMMARGKDGRAVRAFFHCSASLGGQNLVPETYPGIVANFRATFARVRGMKADIFLSNHDNFFDLHAKRARLERGEANAFFDPGELQRFNATMEAAFEKALAEQQAAAGGKNR